MNMARFKTPFKRESSKETLQQRKFKKYYYLKYNSKPIAKTTDFREDNENWVQPSYAQVTARALLKPTMRTHMKDYDH